MHSASPNRALAVAYGVTSPLGRNAWRLFVIGEHCSSVWVGWAYIANHVAPYAQSRLEPLVGAEGVRAHILTHCLACFWRWLESSVKGSAGNSLNAHSQKS